jgi:hypothetical protein
MNRNTEITHSESGEEIKGRPLGKVTPCPWRIEGSTIFGADEIGVAQVQRTLGEPATAQANAQVIAAAPELLNELIKTNIFLVHIVKPLAALTPPESPVRFFLQGHIELNAAIILKAKGEQP